MKRWLNNTLDTVKQKLGIRSPSLTVLGHYRCEKCRYFEDCICVVCEEGNHGVCNRFRKHVEKFDTCKEWRPKK